MSERKNHFVSLHIVQDGSLQVYGIRVIVYNDFDTDNATAHILPTLTPEESLTFVRLIDPRTHHIAINDERMPKRAAYFKLENVKLKVEKAMQDMLNGVDPKTVAQEFLR